MFEKASHAKLLVLLGLLSFLFLMFGNNIVSLTHPDEVFYIQTAKEMLARDSWMVPYIFDAPQFEKPIFSYWLFMGAIKLFGLTPTAARFAPALFGIIGVLVTYWAAFMIFRNKKTAFLSSAILSTSFIYIALSRAVLTDMIFSVLVVISLAFFYYGYTDKSKRGPGIIFCFVFSGLAVLAKGLLGIVFPVVIIGAYLLLKRDAAFFKTRATLWGALLFLLIALPWHIAMWRIYGQSFIDEYLHNVHIRRIFDAEHQKSNTWYFYLMTMFGGCFPWSLFFIPTAYVTYKRRREAGIDFLLLWIALTLGIVQIAESKLASYVFPVFPAIAILLGNYFTAAQDRDDVPGARTAARWCAAGMAIFLAGVAVAGIIYGKQYIDVVISMRPVYVLAGLTVVCAGVLAVGAIKKRVTAITAGLASMTAVVLLGAFLMAPVLEPWVSCKSTCDLFNTMDTGNKTVLCSKFYVRGVRYYTDRKTAVIDINGKGFFSPHPIPFLNTHEKLLNFLRNQHTTYCIVKESNVEDLRRIAGAHFRITEYGGTGGKYILELEKM